MTRHRNLDYNDRLPEAVMDALMDFISTHQENFVLTLANPTTVQLVAGADNALVAVGINGRWRYNTATVNAAHPGGAAATYDVYVTGSDNSFVPSGNPPGQSPENDLTVYAFGLAIRAAGSPPATALYRKVGTVVWDGAAITKLTNLVGPFSGADALPWTTIHGAGTLAARPAASAANAGYLYLATDVNGGTIYRSDGATWTKAALGATESPSNTAIAQAILLTGTLGTRPAAAAGNTGYYYYATDTNGGTLYQSTGSAWTTLFERVPNGGSIASAAALSITDDFHLVTGSTSISSLTGLTPTAGRRVTLIFQATCSVLHNSGNIRLAASLHAGFVANETLTLMYDGSNWIEVSRSTCYLSGQGGIILNGAATPTGLLAEDGSAISRTTFAAWFANVGTLYGAGDGSTTVNLPDSRGRVDVGFVPSGGHADVSTRGLTEGVAVASRRMAHKHVVVNPTVASHNHGGGDHVHGFPNNPTYGAGGTPPNETGTTNNRAVITQTSASGVIITSQAPATSGGTVGPQTGAEPTDAPAYLVRPKFTRV